MGSSPVSEKSPAVPRPKTPTTASAIAWQVAWFFLWLLPNPVLRLSARNLFAENGAFNIDLLLGGAIALFLPAAWSPVLITVAMAVDIVAGIMRTWFFTPQDLIQTVRMLPSLPAERLAGYALLVLAVFGGFGWAAWVVRRRTAPRFRIPAALLFVLMATLFVTVDMISGGRNFSGVRDTQGTFFLARVPEHTLFRKTREIYALRTYSRKGQLIDSASAHLLRNIPSGQRPDIVNVLVESWGTDVTGVIDQKLLSLYQVPAIRARYQIVTGTVPFAGATIYGETRELCNSTIGFGILRSSLPKNLAPCLPQKLKAMGYRTEGVHGYFGGMYARYLWYPRIGFDSVWFERRLHSAGLTDCPGPFPGVCDAQVAQWLGGQLAHTSQPLFIHWMTLNSHLPVPSELSGLNPVSCDFDPLVRDREPLCAWFKLEYQVHSSIARLAARPDIPPTAFAIVGDHAPPFVASDMRNRFADDRVPFLLLIPRQIAGPGPPDLLLAGSHPHPVNARGPRPPSAGKAARHRSGKSAEEETDHAVSGSS